MSSFTNPWRFQGGYYDTQTGYTKFGTRYYNPTIGRWTQPEPVYGQQLYSFAGNNPINRTDPTGMEPCSYIPNSFPGVYDWKDDCQEHDDCYDEGDRGFDRIACDVEFSISRRLESGQGGPLNPFNQAVNFGAEAAEGIATAGTLVNDAIDWLL